MSETEKRKKGLFGRMFGNKDEPSSSAQESVDEPHVPVESAQQDQEAEDIPIEVREETLPPNVPESSPDETSSLETPPDTVQAETDPVSSKTEEGEKKRGWFGRLKDGLKKSSSNLSEGISGIFTKRKLEEDTLQELEDILIQADLGVDTAMRITDKLAETRLDKNITTEEVQEVLAGEVETVLTPVAKQLEIEPDAKPFIILMVGVNGAGKTTTIGKLSRKFSLEGRKVMLAAGDTFRAAAVEQLDIWGQRTGAPVLKRDVGADAAGLAFDAIKEAQEQNVDILMMDTAGRLQNKAHLMEELKKIIRVMKKLDENAPHAVLLVLDATTGQNALNQTKVFGEAVDVTGLVMTKLDGSARGGILVAIADRFKLPVHFIGVGEGVEDLQPFKAEDFARAIAQI